VWLGPGGKSGIWIKRSLNELTIFVVAAPFDRSPVESGDEMRELYDLILQIESTGEILSIPRTPAASESSNDCSCQKTEVCPEYLNHLS
jgi:hypothetical protein